MRLEMGTFPVRDVVFDQKSRLAGDVLHINREDVASLVLKDPRIKEITLEIVKPGESTRILNVRDAVEPRFKVEGPGGNFPGILSGTEPVGRGRTHRLAGVAVMESALAPQSVTAAAGSGAARNAFIDMTGPGALSPFAKTINVVLCTELMEGLNPFEFENALQLAGLKVATYLGETTKALKPPTVEVFDTDKINPSLPNVVYIHCTGGTGRDSPAGTDFYGLRLGEILPTFVKASEFIDGAVVADALSGMAVKVSTWHEQTNPIIWGLLRRHGVDLNFLGVILMRIRFTKHQEKEMVAYQAAKLAKQLGAQGAILTWPSAGNMMIDCVLTAQECENLGVKSVFMTYEHGGKKGDEPPLLYMSPKVDAIISTGSLDRSIQVPGVERVVGGTEIVVNPETGEPPRPANGELDLEWFLPMYASVDHYGFTKQSCIEY